MTGVPQRERFGTRPDGVAVDRITLRGGGLTARLLTQGVILQDLRMDGIAHPLVLGAPVFAPYLGPLQYFGALVGRFANRIAGGQITVDGLPYQIDRNENGRTALHGGHDGAGVQVWTVTDLQPDAASFALTLPDGHMGFPGTLTACVEARVADGALTLTITARTDRATPCSFAHHSYFNLDGSADITGHLLCIDAPTYLPVDADRIPTQPTPVDGTPFDFRAPRPVGDHGYDHNFCVASAAGPLRPVARLTGPQTGLTLTVETTEPGLQIYDGAHIHFSGGLDGRHYGRKSGIALETQAWPDAPNRPDFPPALLRTGDTYRHIVRYAFSAE